MGSGGNIGPKIGVQGEAEFKRQIGECNTTLKTLGTEMNKVTSAFIGNENSTKALKAANKELEKQLAAQADKANVLRNRMDELTKQGVDPSSAAYQKLEQELNKTEADMNKTSAAIESNKEKMTSFGDVVSSVASAVGNVLSGALNLAVEGAKKFAGAMLDAAAAADDLQTLATQTGISTAELQKFQYAAGTIDVSVDTLAGSMSKLTKNMASAANGSKATQEAFAKLGVEVTNSDGSFRDRNEVFKETIAALGEIPDEVERDAAAMAIFGKSATELNPLILGGADALEQLGQQAKNAGLIMSEDSVNALATLNDKFDVLKQTVSMAGTNILAQFAGPLSETLNSVTYLVERLFKGFQEGGIDGFLDKLGSTIEYVGKKLEPMIQNGAEFATKFVISITETILGMLPDIAKTAISLITTLADSLAKSLPELIPVAIEAILTLIETLTDPANISNLVDAAIAIIMALANGLIAALPQLIEKAPEIIANLVTAIVENVPKLLTAAYEVIKTLVKGIIEKLPEIGKAAGEIIGRVVRGIIDLVSDLWDTGKQIVEGIWQGISNTADWLWNQVKGFFGGLLSKIKEFLGIASPSKVFADVVGKNMALGIGVGFDKAMEGVERDMMSAIPTPEIGVNASGLVSGSDTFSGAEGGVLEIVVPVTLDGIECGRGLYRYIIGEGNRLGPAMVM